MVWGPCILSTHVTCIEWSCLFWKEIPAKPAGHFCPNELKTFCLQKESARSSVSPFPVLFWLNNKVHVNPLSIFFVSLSLSLGEAAFPRSSNPACPQVSRQSWLELHPANRVVPSQLQSSQKSGQVQREVLQRFFQCNRSRQENQATNSSSFWSQLTMLEFDT